jgi:hypothetical protein
MRSDSEDVEPIYELLLMSPRLDTTWARLARLRMAVHQGQWDPIGLAIDDITRADLGVVLRALLSPARNPEASQSVQIEAYRLLLTLLAGHLRDRQFAKAVHREWIDLSLDSSSAIRLGSRKPVGRL